MNALKIFVVGIAMGAILTAAVVTLTLSRQRSTAPLPAWPLVDSDSVQSTFTREQMMQGSAMMWQIYSQGYKDGRARHPAPGFPLDRK